MVLGHKRSVRSLQPAARGGFGTHFQSPLKPRDKRKKRVVEVLGRAPRTAAARQHLDALLRREPAGSAQATTSTLPVDGATDSDATMADWVDLDTPPLPSFSPSSPSRPRDHTGSSAQRLNDAWNRLLLQLESPWLRYYEDTHSKPRETIPASLQYSCIASCEASTVSKIKCLYPTRV